MQDGQRKELLKNTAFLLTDEIRKAVEGSADLSVKPPQLLYHFTDAPGLLGIIETGELWGTHTSWLNDASEVGHGLQLAKMLLQERAESEKSSDIRDIFISASTQLAHPVDPVTSIKFDAFIASFCGREDKSVHWLHYGRQGHGYAIGIDSSQIETCGWWSLPVLYEEEAQRRVLNLIYDTVSSFLSERISAFQGIELVALKASAVVSAVSTCRGLAPCFKHHAFADEEEWRAYQLHIESVQISDRYKVVPEFRASSDRIVPFLKLPLPDKAAAIKEIVFGSQVDERAMIESLTFLFGKIQLTRPTFRRSVVPLQGG